MRHLYTSQISASKQRTFKKPAFIKWVFKLAVEYYCKVFYEYTHYQLSSHSLMFIVWGVQVDTMGESRSTSRIIKERNAY